MMGSSENLFEPTKLSALPEEEQVVRLEAQSAAILYEEVLLRNRSRMTLIGRIFTDNFDPCVSVFYRNSAIDENNKPQIKSPRVTPREGVYTYCFAIRGRGVENPQGFGIDERRYIIATDFSKTIHRKGRKERKATPQKSLRLLCPLWLNLFFSAAAAIFHSRTSRVGDICSGGTKK